MLFRYTTPASRIRVLLKSYVHLIPLSLILASRLWTGAPAFGQAMSGDGSLVYIPPTAAELSRLASQAAAFVPRPELNPANKRAVTKLSDRAYKIAAWPQAGFNYDYYLYIPKDFAGRLLFATSIASGGAQGMGPEYYSDWARKVVLEGSWEREMAQALGAPLLYPAFDRPANSSPASLNRDAMLLRNDRLSRLDLQFVAMIDDARAFIAAECGVELGEKILLAGFSMSASFASRFTLMHPERVRAAAYGGTSFMHILPYSRDAKSGVDLIYPIGVADLASIAGRAFARDEYLAVPRFLTMGLRDSEDTTRYGGLFPGSMTGWIDTRLGAMEGRWNTVTELMGESGGFECKLYRELGHSFVVDDYVAFLRRRNIYRDEAAQPVSGADRAGGAEAPQGDRLGACKAILGSPATIIRPILEVGPDGCIKSVELSFASAAGEAIAQPDRLVRRIQVQIDVRPNSGYQLAAGKNPNRVYDSPLLPAGGGRHVLTRSDIRLDLVAALFVAYEDLSGHQYLIMYRPR